VGATFVGITGASGAIYGVRLVRALVKSGEKVHVALTPAARRVLAHENVLEVDPERPDPERLFGEEGIELHPLDAVDAPPASGSYGLRAAIVAPCSMGTAARIAAGLSSNLIERAADVALKEGRPLVLVPRETPLSRLHLDTLSRLAWAGATILPASPGFYHRPRTVEDLVDHVVLKILDQIGVPNDLVRRWGSEPEGDPGPKGSARP
jgi:4-hydroxy-3-polyprenylbenzoate decarboxylase